MANTGSISGQVIDLRNYLPIEDATVETRGPHTKSTKTDANGKFNIDGLSAANDFILTVAANGYQRHDYENLVVIDGTNTDLMTIALDYED